MYIFFPLSFFGQNQQEKKVKMMLKKNFFRFRKIAALWIFLSDKKKLAIEMYMAEWNGWAVE